MTAQTQVQVTPGLTEHQRDVLVRMLGDALACHTLPGDCADCEAHPAGLCDRCGDDLDAASEYAAFAKALGVEVPRSAP